MAQTVLYLLNNTENSVQLVIQPTTFDGSGGVQRNTDLTLYGNGAPNWGDRFDENFYRLIENFAVDQKNATLFHPKDETDLGDGFGINIPIPGQLWFNKTRSRLFVYTGAGSSEGWRSVSNATPVTAITPTSVTINWPASSAGTYPIVPQVGEFAFNTVTNTLVVFNGTTWVTTGNFVQKSGDTMTGILSMGGNKITNLANPTSNQDAATKIYVDNATGGIAGKVNRSGDTMTGFLTLNANPVNALHAATKQYVDNSVASRVPAGVITLWFGNAGSVPSGWAICNGSNGTPDLRDKFVVGAGSSYAFNATGGATSGSVTLPSHNHIVNGTVLTLAQIPTHFHRTRGTYGGGGYDGGGNEFLRARPGYPMQGVSGDFMEEVGGSGSHNHTTQNATGVSNTFSTLPPYRALYYIMKL